MYFLYELIKKEENLKRMNCRVKSSCICPMERGDELTSVSHFYKHYLSESSALGSRTLTRKMVALFSPLFCLLWQPFCSSFRSLVCWMPAGNAHEALTLDWQLARQKEGQSRVVLPLLSLQGRGEHLSRGCISSEVPMFPGCWYYFLLPMVLLWGWGRR